MAISTRDAHGTGGAGHEHLGDVGALRGLARRQGERRDFEGTIHKISDDASHLSVALDETVSVTNSYNEHLAEEIPARCEQINKMCAQLMSD